MEAIICTDLEWGFGKDNGLLYHIKEDMKWFKEKTLNRNIVMGKRTLESLPKPLPNRKHWVITSDLTHSLLEKFSANVIKINELNNLDNPICIGGSHLLESIFPQITKIWLTKVHFIKPADVDVKWMEKELLLFKETTKTSIHYLENEIPILVEFIEMDRIMPIENI